MAIPKIKHAYSIKEEPPLGGGIICQSPVFNKSRSHQICFTADAESLDSSEIFMHELFGLLWYRLKLWFIIINKAQ